MRPGETEREMVQRHIRQSEQHFTRQIEIIEALELGNYPTNLAKQVLSAYERSLHAHMVHLDKLI